MDKIQLQTDFTLEADDGTVIKCHKYVLAANCPYFDDLPINLINQAEVTGYSGATVSAFVEYLYADKIPPEVMEAVKRQNPDALRRIFPTEKFSLDLLKMANQYSVEDLESDCADYLSRTITSQNAVEFWRSATTLPKSEKKLKEAALQHIFSVRSIDQIPGFEETFRSPEMVREFVDYTFRKALLHEVEDAIQ